MGGRRVSGKGKEKIKIKKKVSVSEDGQVDENRLERERVL